MDHECTDALDVLADGGRRLHEQWRFDWPENVQQAVNRLRLDAHSPGLPVLVAVAGGASSGKSTVFNNLLGGHLTSRVTIRGHATLGPILAVHESQGAVVEPLLTNGRLLTGCHPFRIELGENVAGEPDRLAVVFHTIESLRDVLLIDTPDFTSDASFKEGDWTLSLLPWFDRVLLLVDHERWFDRQSISEFRTRSVRLGQQRLALFNRTREGTLGDRDRAALSQQAERLAADAMVVLEFRRGRGFCQFAPGTLDEVFAFLKSGGRDRTGPLLRHVADAAHRTLNQNEERRARFEQLAESLSAVVERLLPSTQDCMIALMTPQEHEQFAPVSRVLRIPQARQWISQRTRRIHQALKRLPILGAVVPGASAGEEEATSGTSDRRAIAAAHFAEITERQAHEVRRLVRTSAFWHEITRWTGLQPDDGPPVRAIDSDDRLDAEVERLDTALQRWAGKIETEVQGVNPHVRGAVGAGAIVLAVVLIAVPGPVTALTVVAAKGAIGAALSQLAAATGAGALFGKQIRAFSGVVREKLVGSSEFDEVQQAASSYRRLMEAAGRRTMDAALEDASRFVASPEEPLLSALEQLRDAGRSPHE